MQAALLNGAIERFREPLQGQNLPASSLIELLRAHPFVWLQFLRHLGCIYCKGIVQDIRVFLQHWQGQAKPVLFFVHPNTLEEGERFFSEFYPGAAHIADPSLQLYRLFRVRRASLFGQLRLANAWRVWQLLRRGLSNDRPTADPYLLHASFLFHQGTLVWSYYAKNFSDVPDWRKIL